MKRKTNVYIDGFNLYYGCLKNSPYKWLDVKKLCENCLNNKNVINKIRYFTANVSGKISDPKQPLRQQIYLRALKTIDNLKIHYGHFLSNNKYYPLAKPPHNKVEIMRMEEKGSDVNLAVHLLNDAFKNDYDVAVIISNDSDLAEAIKIVKKELKKTVLILNPQKKSSRILSNVSDYIKRIRKNVLVRSQFPDYLTDENGDFHKPNNW
jgi:uncharacterized LabA/DUF88 family protein